MLKKYKKLIIILSTVLVLFALYGYDVIRASTYKIEVISISPEEPIADAREQVTVVLKLTKGGQPVEGHSLFTFALDGGQFRGNRMITDSEGTVTLTYIPYTAGRLLPARPVTVEVVNESNSVFFEVNTKLTFFINLKEKP